MSDGKKDTNGLRNKKKIGKKSMNKRKLNFFPNLWNTKMKITRAYT